jgi:hypothetical protein
MAHPGDRAPSCALEALNTDVLIAIMLVADSPADLHALINASPILYSAFLSTKAAILLSFVATDFGPILADAATLAQTSEPFQYTDDYYDRVEAAISQYGLRLSQGNLNCSSHITADMAPDVLHFSRAVQYFVDWYLDVRIVYLRNKTPLPHESAFEASATERRRIAQALFRYQIIVNLYGGSRSQPYDVEFFFTRMFALFKPWEMEQVSQISSFVYAMAQAMLQEEAAVASTAPDWDSQLSEWRPNKKITGHYHYDLLPNLVRLRQRLRVASAADPMLVDRLRDRLLDGELAPTIFSFLNTSHRSRHYRVPTPPLAAGDHETGLPPQGVVTFLGDDVEPPRNAPFAWVDALGGRVTNRWGPDLIPPAPEHMEMAHRRLESPVDTKFERWRWIGFIFWDRSRVEALKADPLFAWNETGWLANPWTF